jgi:hypothetical protein
MSVTRTTGLTVRVRASALQDAVHAFQNNLETKHRIEFDKQLSAAGNVGDASTVINLVMKLDQTARESKGRCFGSRLHFILESVNKFSRVVSTFVSSNPETAALVGGSVQFTLLVRVV